MRLAIAIALMAGPAFADQNLRDFMGGHGCTIGPQSRTAAEQAGFSADNINGYIETALIGNTATRQGDYVVIKADVCTIRLPDIQSDLGVQSPEVLAVTPYVRVEMPYADKTIVHEGCLLNADLDPVLRGRVGGDPDLVGAAYAEFMAANVISGDVRFYAPSPEAPPLAWQIMSGECDRAPNVAAAAAGHRFIETGFDDYIRRLGDAAPCDSKSAWDDGSRIAMDIQGADLSSGTEFDPDINAYLHFEWDIIAIAAGWYEGTSGSERGTPRPPLCHYRD